MNYTRIVLVGYKRMLANGIDHFEMNLVSSLQLILGKNGSGKSSLLWELSPVPANSADFIPGGSKTVELEHKGHRYKLSSSFGAKQEHSFEYDGEELNKGHTISVQKDLVKDHFRITQDIQELVCGHEEFTHMSTARRKDWFLRLCDVNYDYALSVYGKIKNAHRDRAGAIRLERKSLVVESEKLLSDQEMAKIGEETQWLHECLNHLLEYRKPVETDMVALDTQTSQTDRQLVNLANSFTEIHQRINDREHSDAELVDLISESNDQVIAAQTKIGMLAESHAQVAQKVSVLQKAGENTISSIEAQLLQLHEKIAKLGPSDFLTEPLAQPELALVSFSSIKLALIEIFTTIPNNADKRYSSIALSQAREHRDVELKALADHQTWMAEKRASLSHMKDHMGKPDVTCPKCNHAFSLIYSEDRMLALTRMIAEREDLLATDVVPGIVELEKTIEECGRYGSLFRQFQQLTQNSPSLKGYWDYLLEKRILTDAPDQGPTLLERFEQDMLRQISVWQHREKANGLQATFEQLKSVGDADLSDLQAQEAQLEEQLSEQTHLLQLAQNQNAHYKSQFALRAQATNIRKGMRKAIYTHRALLKDKVEHQRRTIMNQLIRDLQSALATREHALFAARRQKDVVDSMTLKIQNLVKEEQALGVLAKELSPTEGLIAEGMLGFIKNFCDTLNSLIDKVWTYPMAVQSCEVMDADTLDLDYRFAFLVGEDNHRVSDVSRGSAGMREMFNLAFRITAMHYLNMEDYPLYLDEPGAAFDKDHRVAAANLIRSIIEQNTFPQVFMISHYESMYGALANAQVNVLDENDTLKPQNYNEHVTMH